ncbi:MAG: Ig domain-containing protein [Prevotella sp.]|jgi:hypothetical protein|nr:Ig domain-containing protein [Prevotella sp.]
MKKTFYLLAILMCASLSGIKAQQTTLYPDATTPTTLICDFSDELGTNLARNTNHADAAGFTFNFNGFFPSQTGGVLDLERTEATTTGYATYGSISFPTLNVSGGATVKIKYSTTGFTSGAWKIRWNGVNANTSDFNVTEGSYLATYTVNAAQLTNGTDLSSFVFATAANTIVGPGHILIDWIQIGPDVAGTATSKLTPCGFFNDFNDFIPDYNYSASFIAANWYGNTLQNGVLTLSGANANWGGLGALATFTFRQPVNILSVKSVSMDCQIQNGSTYTGGGNVSVVLSDGTTEITKTLGGNGTNIARTSPIDFSGNATFNYTNVTKLIISQVSNKPYEYIKIDNLLVGEMPLESESIPESTVGTPITPIDMSANVCSCITPESWSATGLPDGLVINSSTGIISGTPTVADSDGGTATVTMTYDTNKTISVEVPYGIVNAVTGISAADMDKTSVSVRYYNLQGVEITAPVKGQVHIAKEVYPSGAVKAVKRVN